MTYTPEYPIIPIIYGTFLPVNTGMSIWDVFDGSESTQESTLGEERDKYTRPQGCTETMSDQGVLAYCLFPCHDSPAEMDTWRLPPTDSIRCEWPVGTPMQDKLSAVSQVLLDKEKWISHL